MNEVNLMCAIYTVFCFTPWIPDAEIQFYFGYMVIILVGGNFLIGVISMLLNTLCNIKYDMRVKLIKKRYKKWR